MAEIRPSIHPLLRNVHTNFFLRKYNLYMRLTVCDFVEEKYANVQFWGFPHYFYPPRLCSYRVESSFWKDNRPLTSSKNPHFQKEAKCTAFLAKMTFICMRMKKHFHIKSWGLNVVLMQRPGGSRKWFITNYSGAPPYGHLGNTVTSLLQTLFFGPEKGNTFPYKKKPLTPVAR